MKIETGTLILVVLQNPREKVWGVLGEINQAGVFVHGIDLNSFEALVTAVTNDEPFYGLSKQFLPLWRVERITRDESDGDIPSMEIQFTERTGAGFSDFLLAADS